MPLLRKPGTSAPRELGLFWSMQATDGRTIDVYVFASALQSFDQEPIGPVGVLKRHRSLIEDIASSKYDRDVAIDNRLVHITADDLTVATLGTHGGENNEP